MTQMRYKDYVFAHNPARIEVENRAQLAVGVCPGLGVSVQHLGQGQRRVTGGGFFFGKDAMAQFRRLQAVFQQRGAGLLCLPDMPAIRACFASLTMVGEGAGDIIEYAFEFIEDSAGQGA